MYTRFDKIDEFTKVPGSKFEDSVLFDHGLFDKISNKIKYLISEQKVALQIVLIIISERSEFFT